MMIPYEQRQLEIAVISFDVTRWPRTTSEALLEVVERNEWLPITEMQLSVDDPWQPYDRARAVALVAKRGVGLRASSELALEGSVTNNGRSAKVAIWLTPEVFQSRPESAVESWIARTVAAFPDAQFASASADDEQTTLKLEHDLVTMPLFRDVGWLHVLCPSAYPAHYDRASLLAAPCHRVEERADGTIWIWVYEHPLRYDDPGVRDAIVRLNKYLQAHLRS